MTRIQTYPDPTKNKKSILWLLLNVLLAALLPDFLSPALPVLCLIFYLRENRKSIPLPRPEPLVLSVAVFLLWRMVGCLYSGGFWLNGLSINFLWFLGFLGMYLAAVLIRDKQTLEKALYFGALSGGIAGGIGTAQILIFKMKGTFTPAQRTFFNPFWEWLNRLAAKLMTLSIVPEFIKNEIPRAVPIDINDRANSTFTNPVFFACFMVIAFPLAVWGILQLKERKKRLLCAGSALCMLGGLAFSYSRGPYLALGAAVFVLLFLDKRSIFVLLGASPLAGLAMWKTGMLDRLLTIFSSTDVSINTRTDIWKAVLELLREKWLFGLGTGVEPLRKILTEQYGIKQPHAHNLPLELLIESGILGLLLFAGIVGLFAWQMLRLCRVSQDARRFAVCLLAAVCGFLACGVTEYIFYGPKLVQFFLLILGVAQAGGLVLRERDAAS